MDGATTAADLADLTSSATDGIHYQLSSPPGLQLGGNRTFEECYICDGAMLTTIVPDGRFGGVSNTAQVLCCDALQVAGLFPASVLSAPSARATLPLQVAG